MTLLLVLGGSVSVALGLYLLVALLFPEKME